ncbi:MAG TPA: uracil-DNA glycosylase [Vicinamibacterales bacterium]|nr:uracil-DNA glycosylase [Vicinamibacterales bacterium]
MKSALAEHLRYYAELGVAGFSTDPVWRERQEHPVAAPHGAAESPVAREEEPSVVGESASEAVPVAGPGSSAAALAQIRAEIGDCTRCRLHAGRTNLVFGVGNPDAELMFVGEGPGADEDMQGEPFVGRAGQLLTQIIKAMGYDRSQVYIANVVKCRPPNNRNPEPDEIEQCQPFLMRQIEAIRPRVVVALGKFAAQTLLQTSDPITRLRGRFYTLGDIEVMPTFHPSYLLRTPSAKREVWEDMKKVMAFLREGR